MADKTISNIVAEMSAGTSERHERERAKAQKAVQQERIDEQTEVAKRAAVAAIDERDRRDQQWFDTHLGSLTPAEYRTYCRERFGFDPGV